MRVWLSLFVKVLGIVKGMTQLPTVDEALQRARQAQEERLKTIQALVEARQHVHDVREETARELSELQAQIKERIAAAEKADRQAFAAAKRGGWTVQELRKIGLPEPGRTTRTKRQPTRKNDVKPEEQ